jgi:hypothetical protein
MRDFRKAPQGALGAFGTGLTVLSIIGCNGHRARTVVASADLTAMTRAQTPLCARF